MGKRDSNKGEAASREGIDQLGMGVRGAARNLERLTADIAAGDHEAIWEVRRLLESGVQSACYMVYGMAELSPEKRGMSTTCSAMLIGGGYPFAAHVGDSRVYRLRGPISLQITEHHTLLNYKIKHGLITPEEAEKSTAQHVITLSLIQLYEPKDAS